MTNYKILSMASGDENDSKDEEVQKILEGIAGKLQGRRMETGGLQLIPRYDGRKESKVTLKEFVRAVDSSRTLHGWTEEETVSVFKLCASGPAASCLENARPKTFKEAKEALEDRFAESPGLANVMTMLSEPRQRPGEDCITFVERLERLKKPSKRALEEAGMADVAGFLEKTLLATLKRGLRNDRIRTKLIEKGTTTLEEAGVVLKEQERVEKEYYGSAKDGAEGALDSLEVNTLQKLIQESVREAVQKTTAQEVAAMNPKEATGRKKEWSRSKQRSDYDQKEQRAGNRGVGYKCYNCGRLGHFARECWSKKKENGQRGGNWRKEQESERIGRKEQPRDRGGKETIECYYCRNKGHMARNCFKRKRDQKGANGETAKNVKEPLVAYQQTTGGDQQTDNKVEEQEVWN